MSRESDRRDPGSAKQDDRPRVAPTSLPNELLLEVWYHLPGLERVCVSQVCRQWRALSLSTPRLWSRVTFVSTLPSRWSPYPAPADRQHTVYWPRNGITNDEFLQTLLLRSGSLPLDVTLILGSQSTHRQGAWDGLQMHSARISRINIRSGPNMSFMAFLLLCSGELPALRTVTGGFDEDDIVYHDLPVQSHPETPFPALTQVHLGAGLPAHFVFFIDLPVPSLQELTLTPFDFNLVLQALPSCPKLTRLNIGMSQFSTRASSTMRGFRQFTDLVAPVRELCLMDIPEELDAFVLTSLNDARFRHLVLDYQGRESIAGLRALPSPSALLGGELHMTVRLRESVYTVEIADDQGLRRDVLFDQDVIDAAPTLWGYYLSQKAVVSATVDALAWNYFAEELHTHPNTLDLTIIIQRASAELEGISFAAFPGLRTLQMIALRSGVRFNSSAVLELTKSISGTLRTLSLPRNAVFNDVETLVAQVAGSLQWH